MKNKKLIALFCITLITKSSAQELLPMLAFKKGCMVALATSAAVTAWNFLTENTATKSVDKKSRLKLFLDKMYHNLLYIGLPVATVAGGLSYIGNAQTQKPTQQFFSSLEQHILRLLPRFLVKKATDKNHVELNGFEESIDAFMERYGSPIKTVTKTVVVHTAKGAVFITKQAADVLQSSIEELRNQKKIAA